MNTAPAVSFVVTDPWGVVVIAAFFVLVGYLLAHVTQPRVPHPSAHLPARVVHEAPDNWPTCAICETCRPADAFLQLEGQLICRRGCDEPAPVARVRQQEVA